jgi:uroporphyrin-3 C-methyltransferase
MTTEPQPPEAATTTIVPAPEAAGAAPPAVATASTAQVTIVRGVMYLFLAIAVVALVASGLLWQKLSGIQEQLARQSADSGANAIEARALARQAQELARDTSARQALTETRLGEVALQRTQIEELMQSLSRSRDENLLVDIESALRLAQQQAQLTGSVEPLLAELRSADKRLDRAAQPRLSRVRGAIARDIDRVRTASVTDLPGLLVKLDELARQVDELPLANAVASPAAAIASRKPASAPAPQWWEKWLRDVQDEVRGLVRVSRVDQPEAALLAPEQSFFLRENLKLKLLNARLALLARQTDAARADVTASIAALRKYFDGGARKTQVALTLAQQVQQQLNAVELPRIDETLAVLATAAAGR